MLLFHNIVVGQIETYTNYEYNGKRYNAVIIKATAESLKRISIVRNTKYLTHTEVVRTGFLDPGSFFINACISDSNCSPLGLYISDYSLIQPVNLSAGEGNFFLKPNAVLLIGNTDVNICKSTSIASCGHLRLAIQSGPCLLFGDTINPAFNPISVNLNKRCGVGVFVNSKRSKFLVFAISKDPVSFYEFALLFSNKFKCKDAMCLESAGCAMHYPGMEPEDDLYNGIICNYIFFRMY